MKETLDTSTSCAKQRQFTFHHAPAVLVLFAATLFLLPNPISATRFSSFYCDVDDPAICDSSVPTAADLGEYMQRVKVPFYDDVSPAADTSTGLTLLDSLKGNNGTTVSLVYGSGAASMEAPVKYAFAAYANLEGENPRGFHYGRVEGLDILDKLVKEKTTEYMISTAEPASKYFEGYDIDSYPVAAYALVPVVNVPELDPDDPIVFSRQTLISIHLGEIQWWDDHKILTENPALIKKLPHQRIQLVVRADECNENLLLTRAFVKFNSSIAWTLPPSVRPYWCGNHTRTTVEGNPQLELRVVCSNNHILFETLSPHIHKVRIKTQEYSMSMMPFQMAQGGFHVASMINAAGHIVAPDISAIVFTEMELGTLLGAHMEATLIDPSGPESWPICSYIYLVIRRATQITTCAARIRSLKFWIWFISSLEAQNLLPTLGLAPLPTFIQMRVTANLKDSVKCVSKCAGVYNVSSCTCALKQSRCIAPLPSDAPVSLTLMGTQIAALTVTNIFTMYSSQGGKNNLELSYVPSESVVGYKTYLSDNTTISFLLTMFEGDNIFKYFGPIADTTITLPFITMAVAVIYRCTEVEATSEPLIVNPAALTGIFLGKITKWNDPVLQNINPKVALPDRPIRVITRKDDSDTTQIITRFLSDLDVDFKSKVGIARVFNPSWFGDRKIVVASDDEAEAAVLQNDYSLAFWRFMDTDGVSIAAMLTPAGNALVPTVENIALCANYPPTVMQISKYQWSTDSTTISAEYISQCYPIYGENDFSVRKDVYGDDCSTQIEVVSFLKWLYGSGDAMSVATSMFGAVIASPTSQELAKNALLQARCNGVSILAPQRGCEFQDMRFDVGVCSSWSQTREVVFSWVDGEDRLCNGGSPLQPSTMLGCDHLPHSSPGAVGIYVVALIGNLLGLIVIIQTVRHWDAKLIVYAQRSFCIIFTIAAMGLCNVSILFLGPNETAYCLVRPWAFNIVSTLMFAVLFMKIRRVSVLFGKTSAMKKIKITNLQVGIQTVSLVSVDVLLLLIWTAASPPRATDDPAYVITAIPELGEYKRQKCSSPDQSAFVNLMRIWKSLLLLYGAYLSKLTWNIDTTFSEARHIAIGIYNSVLVSLLVLGFDFLPVEETHRVLFQAFACAFAAIGCICLVMGPKLLLLYFDPTAAGVASSQGSKDTKRNTEKQGSSAVVAPAKEEPAGSTTGPPTSVKNSSLKLAATTSPANTASMKSPATVLPQINAPASSPTK